MKEPWTFHGSFIKKLFLFAENRDIGLGWLHLQLFQSYGQTDFKRIGRKDMSNSRQPLVQKHTAI